MNNLLYSKKKGLLFVESEVEILQFYNLKLFSLYGKTIPSFSGVESAKHCNLLRRVDLKSFTYKPILW